MLLFVPSGQGFIFSGRMLGVGAMLLAALASLRVPVAQDGYDAGRGVGSVRNCVANGGSVVEYNGVTPPSAFLGERVVGADARNAPAVARLGEI